MPGFRCITPAHPTVQQDDDVARITRWDFEPGATTTWHEHPFPYAVIMLVGGTLRVDDGAKHSDVELAEGQAYLRPAGIKHDVMNASPHPIAFVEIEFKRPEALSSMPRP